MKVEEEGEEGETAQALPHTEPTTRAQSPSTPDQPTTDIDTSVITETTANTQTNLSAIHPVLHESFQNDPGSSSPLFSMEQLGVDRRLIVNRKRLLKMYRVWMQGKFRKLESSS